LRDIVKIAMSKWPSPARN